MKEPTISANVLYLNGRQCSVEFKDLSLVVDGKVVINRSTLIIEEALELCLSVLKDDLSSQLLECAYLILLAQLVEEFLQQRSAEIDEEHIRLMRENLPLARHVLQVNHATEGKGEHSLRGADAA